MQDLRIFEAKGGQTPDFSQADPSRDIVFTWNATASGARIPDTDWLGDSRQAIAVEKAGIFRPGKVAVCAEHAPPAELAPHLAERDIRPLWIGQAFSVVSDGGPHWQLQAADGPTLSLPQPPHLPGLHQLRNAAGVITLLQHLRPSVVLPEGALDAALRAWERRRR